MPSRRPPKFTGLFFDDTAENSAWIREQGTINLPPLDGGASLAIVGELLPSSGDTAADGALGLEIKINDRIVSGQTGMKPGPFRFEIPWPATTPSSGHRLELSLLGVSFSNLLAWAGRVTGLGFLQKWRLQPRNRRLRIQRVEVDGETLCDFGNRSAPWNREVTRRSLHLGLNIVGFFRADLGVGESVRCMARAAEAAKLEAALVELKLHCINPQTDTAFVSRLQLTNPHPVNVFHLDAPVSLDIDTYHGAAFRSGKYNIGYWAWELPEFPDAWVRFADVFDEIWAPSRFAAEAIAQKVSVPVLTMPHAISFTRPTGDFRAKFGLPRDQYLFLFLYDLNSYSERKNPAAVIEAFRRSGLAGKGAALVIKVHNTAANPADFERLRTDAASLPNTTIISTTLSRTEIYELESTCDCFVSLHRSEGFGIAVAESMYLGKPVISTDWSGTAEFVTADNGCPVRCELIALESNHGPYAKGQTWAEPEVAHAAWWMRRLSEDRALGARLGAAARVRMEERYSPAVIGARFRRRLESIASW
ncbi:MAG TPA: glycosyltransferase [Lacunisphaera sp.]|jgi:glycosyltransferase involved in cell wall biosynthesis